MRVMVADFVGWKFWPIVGWTPPGTTPPFTLGSYPCLPDYCGSLDAIHEAEKALTGPQWTAYCKAVDRASRNGDNRLPFQSMNPSYVVDAYMIHATAQQKAEAICRVIHPEKYEQ
jgi:hypothetical protein